MLYRDPKEGQEATDEATVDAEAANAGSGDAEGAEAPQE